VVVIYQALYTKACEDAWKHKDLYAEVLLRLGTFHTSFNLLSIIGKRFQDTGLRDICTESGIIAEGSVLGILEAVQFHRCIYEALLRVIWKQFIAWETNNYPNRGTS